MTSLPLWLRQLQDDELGGNVQQLLSEWLLRIVQTIRQGLIIVDEQGTVLTFNSYMRERYGWTDAERGTSLFANRPLLVAQGLPAQLQTVVQTNEPLEALGVRNVTRNGEEVYQNFWGYPLILDGRTMGAVIQIEDVTEPIRLARELARVKDMQDDIMHSTRDVILALDEQGRISFVNDVIRQWSGYPAERFIGRRAMAFVPYPERCAVIQAGRTLLETGQAGYLETQVRLIAGRRLDVGLSYARLQNRPGIIIILQDISERKQLERALRARNRELSAIGAIAAAVSSTLDLHELLNLALNQILDLTAADAGSILLADERGQLQPGPSMGITAAHEWSRYWDAQQARQVLTTGRPWFQDKAEAAPRPDFQSLALAPLVARGRILGVLALACRRARAFDAECQSLLSAVGQQIGVAVDNARLFAKTQRQLQAMHRLFAASQMLTSTLDLPHMLELIIAAAMQAVPAAQRSAIALLDRERGDLYIGAAQGYGPGIRDFRFPADQGYAGWVLQHRQPLRIDDVATDPRAQLRSEWPEVHDLRAAIAAPLIARGEIIGVLDLANITQTAAFTEDDLQLLVAFANQSAAAIENARLFSETQRRVRELSTLTQIGRAISAALDRDKLLDLIYQQVSLVMDTTNFFIALYDAETETVRFPLAVEGGVHVEDRADFAPRRAGRGLTEHVIQTRAPLLLRRELSADAGIELIGPQARSWLGVPMLIGDRVLGVITVQSYDREGTYDTGHLILLSTIAAQAAIAIENARLYAQARRAEELASLNRISTLVTSSLDPQYVLNTIAAATVRVTSSQMAAIFTRDEHEDIVHLMASHGLSDQFVQQSRVIPLADSRAGAIVQGTVLTIEDLRASSLPEGLRTLLLNEGIRALADLPLRGREQVLGSLTVYYSSPHQFSPDEIEILTTFANHAAVALENARLYARTDRRLRERVTELITLQQVGLRLTATLDLATVLDTIAEAALRLVGASDIHIFLYEPETDQFVFGAGLWDTGERNRVAAMPRRDGITALTAREGRPIVINDAERHPLYNTPEAQPWSMKAIASFPLKCANRVVGVFNIAFLQPHQFSEDELRILSLLADQAAIVIENARLYEEARRLSITDGLTGLYNSRHFYAILKQEMARTARYEHTLSLVMMDIDNFKLYNDTYGHLAGDDLLQDLARLLRDQVRESDLAFRYGGEEFALLLPETDKLAAARLAERVRAAVAQHQFTVKELGIASHVTISFGVAMYPADATDARSFVHAADMALYAAKAAGKNRVRVYNSLWVASH